MSDWNRGLLRRTSCTDVLTHRTHTKSFDIIRSLVPVFYGGDVLNLIVLSDTPDCHLLQIVGKVNSVEDEAWPTGLRPVCRLMRYVDYYA